MVKSPQSSILGTAFNLFLDLPGLALEGESVLPIVAVTEVADKSATCAWVRSLRQAEEQARGEAVRVLKDPAGAEEEVLTPYPALWDVEIAFAPKGTEYQSLLCSQAALLRIIKDNPSLPLGGWFGQDDGTAALSLLRQDDSLRQEAASLVGQASAGLAASVVLTVGIESSLVKRFKRVDERKLSAERMRPQNPK